MNKPHSWRKTGTPDIPQVESFLRTAEPSCVTACARFLQRDGKQDHVWSLVGYGQVISALLIQSRNLLFPVFMGRRDIPLPQFMHRLFVRLPIHAIQGILQDTEILAALIAPLGYKSVKHIDYDLMTLDKEPIPQSLRAGPPGLTIRRPITTDIDELFKLQAAYEQEEVLPPGTAFNAAAARLTLERTLSKGHILIAELGGRLVGKINTNAEAFSRYQIGGVYVHPAYRRLGIATRMTAVLSWDLITRGAAQSKGLTLFVKKSNPGAKMVYRRIGYNTMGNYRITYY